MKIIIKRLEKYLDNKKISLHVKKSKMMEYQKRGERKKKIQETRRGKSKKKTRNIMAQIWSIGEEANSKTT